MLYQTHAFDAKLDHNGCVWYIRLIFNGYCFVGNAVFCQCRICRFALCAGSKDDVSGVPFGFRHIAVEKEKAAEGGGSWVAVGRVTP